jgi:hypothetical protein
MKCLLEMSVVERFFRTAEWMVDTQLNFKCHNKSTTAYDISYADDAMCGIDYRFKFLKMFDLYFTFESANFNELNYIIASRSLSETLLKKHGEQCSFDLKKLRFNLKYENDGCWQKYALGRCSLNIYRNAHIRRISSDTIFPSEG